MFKILDAKTSKQGRDILVETSDQLSTFLIKIGFERVLFVSKLIQRYFGKK